MNVQVKFDGKPRCQHVHPQRGEQCIHWANHVGSCAVPRADSDKTMHRWWPTPIPDNNGD